MPPEERKETNPRAVAAKALAEVANDWPDASINEPVITGMEARDIRLARAIYRTAMQRWYTLVRVLDAHLNKPLWQMEPLMQGVLLSGAAQLLFMDRLPTHAVVDETVDLARKLVRPGAAGLANAVLRKVAALPEDPVIGKRWEPAPNRLPLEDGYVPLTANVLPLLAEEGASEEQTNEMLALHLQAATSHPAPLLRQWITNFGAKEAIKLALHGIVTPPTIVSVEKGIKLDPEELEPHKQDGFAIWKGWHNNLPGFLANHPARRVQDPASSMAVLCTAELQPKLILDLCAGRGTKTRQLGNLHRDAHIIASDTSVDRLAEFAALVKAKPRGLTICPPVELAKSLGEHKADLVLLDVPCSNTGVLARRPGAKYRYNEVNLKSLIKLQKHIIDTSMQYIAKPGYLLYSTCSLDPAENQEQVAYILKKHGGEVVHEALMLPAGHGHSYHDGSYHALIKMDA